MGIETKKKKPKQYGQVENIFYFECIEHTKYRPFLVYVIEACLAVY